jgi:hypothetical protein
MMRVDLPPLHEYQAQIVESPARFKVVAGGRRVGKSTLAAVLAMHEAAQGRRVWLVAPVYRQADEIWRTCRMLARQIPRVRVRDGERMVEFPGGGMIETRSADEPDRLRGAGLDLVILDEAALIAESAWAESLRPALSDRNGRALLISTPRGRDWFWRAFLRGQDEAETDWASWQIPTSANPLIPAAELESARRELPEMVYRAEFLAEFTDEAGSVFRRVHEASTGQVETPNPRFDYYGFCDIAGTGADFFALCIVRREGRKTVQAYVDRWSSQGWSIDSTRILAPAMHYGAEMVLDVSGQLLADPHLERLRQAARGRAYFRGLKFSAPLKEQMVKHLCASLEQGEVVLLDPTSSPAARAQRDELLSYGAQRLPSGGLRYSAPAGVHDDTVASLLAAAWIAKERARRGNGPGQFERITGGSVYG